MQIDLPEKWQQFFLWFLYACLRECACSHSPFRLRTICVKCNMLFKWVTQSNHTLFNRRQNLNKSFISFYGYLIDHKSYRLFKRRWKLSWKNFHIPLSLLRRQINLFSLFIYFATITHVDCWILMIFFFFFRSFYKFLNFVILNLNLDGIRNVYASIALLIQLIFIE